MSTANANSVQAIIDAKLALLASVTAALADLVANPQPDYSIDGQTVSMTQYQRYLMDLQEREQKVIDALISTKNRFKPWQVVRSMRGGC